MNLKDSLRDDELLLKWFKYMYRYETGRSCNDINIMISDLKNRGFSDSMIMTATKSSYPRLRLCR